VEEEKKMETKNEEENEEESKKMESALIVANSDCENIPPELIIKHPLQNSWTLWFFKNDRTRSWEENQRPITTFNTVEDFWCLYNHIELSSRLASGCDYSLFKENIKPMWEDGQNRSGGRWLINLDKKQRISCLDNFWLEVMLCLIGETFDDSSKYVNGAVVSVRNKGDKIGMWLGDSTQGPAIITVGKKVKERLGIDEKTALGFEAHQDTMKKSGSTAKNRYVV
jgi:translation initiation factor 4E